jgi:hypothetical protein
VYLHNSARILGVSNKFTAVWQGQFAVRERVGESDYKLVDMKDKDSVVHINRLKGGEQPQHLEAESCVPGSRTAKSGTQFIESGVASRVPYGCETWSLTLRKENRLRVFENRVLRGIFGPKGNEGTGEWRDCTMRSLTICTPHPLLFGKSNPEYGGRGT